VARIAGGDREALSALYARHASLLLGLALGIVGERREAEDLLHDVFLEVWRAAKDFDPARGRVRTWLCIRMRSRALDLRTSARVSRNAGDAALAALDVPAATVRADELADHRRVRAALDDLGPDQRRVLELAYFDGLSSSEIAERLGIPVGTVKSRTAAGLARLRARLVAGGGGA